MNRILSTILFVAITLTLQWGAMVTYMACKWQANTNADYCRCDEQLMAKIGVQADDAANAGQISAGIHLQSVKVFPPVSMVKIPVQVLQTIQLPPDHLAATLSIGFLASVYRPPAT